MKNKNPQIYTKLLSEIRQSPSIRQEIIRSIEKELNKTIVTFFTSFVFPVMIEDQDAIMLEEVLQNTDGLEKGLILIINSPGGSGLAAERIINVCRSYSKDKFEVIVPNMAKSAATMICLGSNKIYLSKTSELGPIDPQIPIKEGEVFKRLSVHSIITSYENLFRKAVNTKGRLEPYLQQLSRYDARDIEEFYRAMELSESIAVKYLKKGMMRDLSENGIKNKIKPFLSPLKTKSHGRPIFFDEAKKCGLKVDVIDIESNLWQLLWKLYLRTDFVLRKDCAKIIESRNHQFNVGI